MAYDASSPTTRARSELLDARKPGTYHLITRCVRRERLLDRGERKQSLCRGLAGWFGHMAIDLLGYSVMGNHLHLIVRVRPDVAAQWDAVSVARHAFAVLPPRSGPALEPPTVTAALVDRYAGNASWVTQQRTRLSSASCLLRLVKQKIARRANGKGGCTGHFWENRFTRVALLDQAAVLACLVYVDLNSLRAGMVLLYRSSPASIIVIPVPREPAVMMDRCRMQTSVGILWRCRIAPPQTTGVVIRCDRAWVRLSTWRWYGRPVAPVPGTADRQWQTPLQAFVPGDLSPMRGLQPWPGAARCLNTFVPRRVLWKLAYNHRLRCSCFSLSGRLSG